MIALHRASGGSIRPGEPHITLGGLRFVVVAGNVAVLDVVIILRRSIVCKMRICCGRILVVAWCEIMVRTKSHVSNPRIQFGLEIAVDAKSQLEREFNSE